MLRPEDNALAVLEKAGNSIVLFTRQLMPGNAPGNGTERSTHVPLAIRYPGVIKPRTAEGLMVSHVDLVPTVAALCGAELPDGVQGRNLAPLLRGEGGEPPDSVFIEANTSRAVIRGYQKLVTDLAGAPEHLINIASDPDELSDLVHDPGSRLAVDGLSCSSATMDASSWRRLRPIRPKAPLTKTGSPISSDHAKPEPRTSHLGAATVTEWLPGLR